MPSPLCEGIDKSDKTNPYDFLNLTYKTFLSPSTSCCDCPSSSSSSSSSSVSLSSSNTLVLLSLRSSSLSLLLWPLRLLENSSSSSSSSSSSNADPLLYTGRAPTCWGDALAAYPPPLLYPCTLGPKSILCGPSVLLSIGLLETCNELLHSCSLAVVLQGASPILLKALSYVAVILWQPEMYNNTEIKIYRNKERCGLAG